MSDNEDAHSETAPAGWGAMYNNLLNPGRSSSDANNSKQSLPTKDGNAPAANGWLGGWFATQAVPAKSSSADGSEESNSPRESDSSRSDSENGSQQESSNNVGIDEDIDDEKASDLDSDGFPVGPEDEVAAILKAESESVGQETMSDPEAEEEPRRYSVGDVGGMMEPGILRRERIRNRQQYLSTAAAAALALPESSTDAEPTPEQPAAAAGFWTTWFGPPSTQAPAAPESKPVTEPPTQLTPTSPEETKGPTKTEQARSSLPALPEPPEFAVNSFFMSPGGSFFQSSEPIMRFEGRLRGLPRQIAPYWSTNGPSATTAQYRMKPTNPSSTLYMFRVS